MTKDLAIMSKTITLIYLPAMMKELGCEQKEIDQAMCCARNEFKDLKKNLNYRRYRRGKNRCLHCGLRKHETEGA